MTRLLLALMAISLSACSLLQPSSDISATIHGPDESKEGSILVLSASVGSDSGRPLHQRWSSSQPDILTLLHSDQILARFKAANVSADQLVEVVLEVDDGQSVYTLKQTVTVRDIP